MKLLKKIGLTLLAIIILLVLISFLLPSNIHVERSMAMKTSPQVVFNQINILKNWEKWSPWHKIDTAMKLTYEGPESGVGAKYNWESKNTDVGNGKLTIIASVPFDTIVTEIFFADQGTSKGGYIFKKQNDSTLVTWWMDISMGMNPIGKYIGLFMDKMLGNDFIKGLKNLKDICEKIKPESDLKIEQVILEKQSFLGIKAVCTAKNISETLGGIYQEIMQFTQKNGIKTTGSPFAIYYSYSPDKFDLEAGITVDKIVPPTGRIKTGEFKAGSAVVADFYGSYEKVGPAYEELTKWIKENNKKCTGAPWEVYVTDPMTEKDTAKWLTKIYYPLEK